MGGSRFQIEFRLSKDLFWSEDDFLLETNDESYDAPTVGAFSNWSLQCKLPSFLAAGDYYVLSKIDPGNLIHERIEENNYSHTTTPVVRIPEWNLNLQMTGNGSTLQDNVATRYAHQAEVNLVALQDKRTVFVGWSGDRRRFGAALVDHE